MKTSELTGDALVCAVAMCEGYTNLHKIPGRLPHEPQWAMTPPRPEYGDMELWEIGSDCDWAFFGPIIERERIGVQCIPAGTSQGWWAIKDSTFHDRSRPDETRGDTPLVAAMRCYVASKLGDEVDIPEGVL